MGGEALGQVLCEQVGAGGAGKTHFSAAGTSGAQGR